jgi:nicotinate-nucleotide adenylyltransferase
MRVAIFGGSFDPPHRGHLAIARAAAERLGLDRLWMAPAGTQPLKIGFAGSSYLDRLAMARLAVAGESKIAASEIDAPRGDGLPNFTVELMRRVRAELDAEDELFFLLGADSLLSLRQWREAEELLFLCRFIVAGRPGWSLDDVCAALPEGVSAVRKDGDRGAADLAAWELRNQAGRGSELYLMPDLQEDISATDIRAAIAGERSAEGLLAPAVLEYIESHGLYRE